MKTKELNFICAGVAVFILFFLPNNLLGQSPQFYKCTADLEQAVKQLDDKDRQKRIRWLNFDFLNSKLSHEIKAENTKALSSDENESKSEFSNFLQLADVLLGVTRASFVELSTSQKGQKECVSNFIDIIERFNNKKSAYNKQSRYYKKFCLGFFPTSNNLTKEEFLSDGIENLLKRGDFYYDRKTYRHLLADSKNLKLF